jgi:NADH dehydrogenase
VRSCVTVFGGTGFVGRRIVDALLARSLNVRVAARHPERCGSSAPRDGLVQVQADLRDPASVRAALRGADAAVNSVSLYVESRDATFQAIHVDGAGQLARAAAEAGLDRLLHISGIGSDARSTSAYIRARGEGEDAVRAGFPGATILRPSVMFGPDDAFLTTLVGLVERLPVVPLFGDGSTRLQPGHVEDLAEAVAILLTTSDTPAPTYELGGPEVHSYRALLELITHHIGRRRLLLPVSFPLWDVLAAAGRLLPSSPLTEGQVALMRQDNVADPRQPGFGALGIDPLSVETELRRRVAPDLTRN